MNLINVFSFSLFPQECYYMHKIKSSIGDARVFYLIAHSFTFNVFIFVLISYIYFR
jgi:hypothetical protein